MGVELLEAVAAWVLHTAREHASIAIYADLETLVVDVGCDVRDTVRKSGLVSGKLAAVIALHVLPAIVNDDVFVPQLGEAGIDESVSRGSDETVAHVELERIPRVPAWTASQYVILPAAS